jgi:transcriptional regulator with XRE-family HTH domain
MHSSRTSRLDGSVQGDPDSTPNQTVDYGKALRIARAMAGLRQKEVADLAGLNPSHVCLIELGKRKPSVAAVDKLSKALKVPNHLFVLLGAESGDLKTDDPNEIHRAAESLAHLLFDVPPKPRKRTTRSP